MPMTPIPPSQQRLPNQLFVIVCLVERMYNPFARIWRRGEKINDGEKLTASRSESGVPGQLALFVACFSEVVGAGVDDDGALFASKRRECVSEGSRLRFG